MTTAAQPSRLEALGAGNLVRRIVVATVLTLGLLFIIRGLAQRLATSDSPAVYGVLVLGLGLAVAVFYGLWRNTRVGVIVWIVGALLSVTFAGSGLAILDRLTFVALAAGWFISIVTGSQHLRRFGTAEALMVLFLLAHIISTVSPHQLAAFSGLPPSTLIINGVFLPLAAYVIASQSLADPRSIRLFMWFLVGLGFYLGLIAIFQRFGLQQLVFPRQIVDPGLGVNPERSRGPLLNSAADGILMIASLAAALFLGQQKGIRYRGFALLTAAILPIGIFTTQTRAIYLGAAVVVVGGAMFARGYRRWYFFLLAGAAAMIAINFRTFLSADRTQGGVTSTGEVESRLNDWATAIWAFREKPAFGWGIARYPEVNTVHHQAWPGIDWQLGWGYLSHNTHLAFAAELGAVGVILWVGILGAIVVKTARAYNRLPQHGMVSRGLVLAFWLVGVGWVLNAAVIDVRLFLGLNVLMFTWAGILAGLAEEDPSDLERMNRMSTPQRTAEPVGMPAEPVGMPPELMPRPGPAVGVNGSGTR